MNLLIPKNRSVPFSSGWMQMYSYFIVFQNLSIQMLSLARPSILAFISGYSAQASAHSLLVNWQTWSELIISGAPCMEMALLSTSMQFHVSSELCGSLPGSCPASGCRPCFQGKSVVCGYLYPKLPGYPLGKHSC